MTRFIRGPKFWRAKQRRRDHERQDLVATGGKGLDERVEVAWIDAGHCPMDESPAAVAREIVAALA